MIETKNMNDFNRHLDVLLQKEGVWEGETEMSMSEQNGALKLGVYAV